MGMRSSVMAWPLPRGNSLRTFREDNRKPQPREDRGPSPWLRVLLQSTPKERGEHQGFRRPRAGQRDAGERDNVTILAAGRAGVKCKFVFGAWWLRAWCLVHVT